MTSIYIYNCVLISAGFSICAGSTRPNRVATQEESAGRASTTERAGFDHPRGSVRVEFGQKRGNPQGRRGKRTAPSQPAAVLSQSAHEGE